MDSTFDVEPELTIGTMESGKITINLAILPQMEDSNFLKTIDNQLKQHKQTSFRNVYEPLQKYEKEHEISLIDKGVQIQDQKYINILIDGFERVSPLIYLNEEQKKEILKKIKLYQFFEKHLLYSGMNDNTDIDTFKCFILIEGEIHFLNNNKKTFLDIINDVFLFGYDGPIFQKRFNTVLVEKCSVIGVIEMKDFLHILKPFSQFATFISRNIRYKDKVFDSLTQFKEFIGHSIDKGPINTALLIKYYKKIHSTMHTKVNSDEIDFSAWNYSLQRLPTNIFETYVFVLINKSPRILNYDHDLSKNFIQKILIPARNRDCYSYLEGKVLVLVRDQETDVLDFISNLCIHIIESIKLRKLIGSPVTIQKLYDQKGNFNNTIEVIESLLGGKIKHEDINVIKRAFGDNFADKLLNLSRHYQDYSVQIVKESQIDRDPIENWIQNLWKVSKQLLGISSSLEEINDLVVDIIQGSKKTLVSCFSPHIYKEKENILRWAQKNNIQLKTKNFANEIDRLLAYSYYYYLEFPEKNSEKDEMEIEYGMCFINRTFSTGIKVLLINPNKLNQDYHDPNIKIVPASKNHLILHIGYTFGAQSYHIIKPLLMLFGSKARSLNIIGKAGGLIGNRTDILVADRIILDKNHELCNIDYGNLSKEQLEFDTKTRIHIGPMLTVAGTILQNTNLLSFYKHVMGCIGLEMEGFYFCKEVENCIKHGLLRKNFVTRCFYYISDLPMDPKQNLSQEEGNVSWDEGVGSMNAIQRFIINQIFKK